MENRPEEREEQEKGAGVEEKEYVFRFRVPKCRLLMHPETRNHLRAARREVLLAVRSIVDAAIEGLEPKQSEGKGPTKIEVE